MGKVTEIYARSVKIYMGNVSLESESYPVDHTKEDIFACQFCNFKTTSRAGLKIHKKRKPTNYTE